MVHILTLVHMYRVRCRGGSCQGVQRLRVVWRGAVADTAHVDAAGLLCLPVLQRVE